MFQTIFLGVRACMRARRRHVLLAGPSIGATWRIVQKRRRPRWRRPRRLLTGRSQSPTLISL